MYTNQCSIMKLILLTLFVLTVKIHCEIKDFADISAAAKGYVRKLQTQYKHEFYCLERFDHILASGWGARMAKITRKDPIQMHMWPAWIDENPTKSISKDALRQWLMESSSPGRKINTCMRQLVKKVTQQLRKGDINCLDNLLSRHVKMEDELERNFTGSLSNTSSDQLLFRSFITFHELVELMFQNRTMKNLTRAEKILHENAKHLLSTEKEMNQRFLTMRRNRCDWKNAMALRAARNPRSKFREFASQVRRSLNEMLGKSVLDNEAVISQENIEEWLRSRKATKLLLAEEIGKLWTLKRGTKWLCEYATKLAGDYFRSESFSLSKNVTNLRVRSKTGTIADGVRRIQTVLKEHRRDIRQVTMNSLATKLDRDSQCLDGLFLMIQHHHRLMMASVFTESRYTYPDVFCRTSSPDLGSVSSHICNCSGSFCTVIDLPTLPADDYRLAQDRNGVYHVVSREEWRKGKERLVGAAGYREHRGPRYFGVKDWRTLRQIFLNLRRKV